MSPNGILRMSKTRFICARKSWQGGDRQRSAAVTFAMAGQFNTGDATNFRKAVDMSDDELAAIVSKLTVV